MKKIYLILALALGSCMFFTGAKAQEKTGSWSIDLGSNIAIPIRNLSYFTSLGIGVDVNATTPIADGFAAGGRVNYTYFIGQKALFQDEAHGAGIFNILGSANYTFPQQFFAGVDLGVGFESTNGESDTEFARIFNVGYKWAQSKEHTYIFTVYFDQTTYQKCLGVRGAIRF
jgi:hypothetical protein